MNVQQTSSASSVPNGTGISGVIRTEIQVSSKMVSLFRYH
jgi:hypothetical protein